MEMRKRYVMVCVDDIGWCEQLRRVLQKEKIEVREVEEAEELLENTACLCKNAACALIVSEMTRLQDICAQGRLPVIFADSMQEDERELQALAFGAADYISRERDMEIFVARLRRYIAAERSGPDSNTAYADIYEELWQRKIRIGERELLLTTKEARLMEQFLERKDAVLTREEMLSAGGGACERQKNRSTDMLVAQLRKKLRTTPYQIRSIYGKGYMLERS